MSSSVSVVGESSIGARRRGAWAYLSQVAQGPCAPLSALVGQVGPEDAADAVRCGEVPESLRAFVVGRGEVDRSEQNLEMIAALGGRLITPEDSQWPGGRMSALCAVEGSAPLGLWVIGSGSLPDSGQRAVTVTGSRAASGYGEDVAHEFACDLTARGWVVVAGGGFGIDAAAHRAAVHYGSTVAVLPCGLDRMYPAGHSHLFRYIGENGLLVSEFAPGVAPSRERFLTRNRLLAALSDASVIVEAGVRSGSLDVLRRARRLGAAALAVPGPVTSAASQGCNRMIGDGHATLVTTAEEIIEIVTVNTAAAR